MGSRAEFLGRVRPVMSIPALVDSNHPFIEGAHALAGSPREEAKKEETEPDSPAQSWEDVGGNREDPSDIFFLENKHFQRP